MPVSCVSLYSAFDATSGLDVNLDGASQTIAFANHRLGVSTIGAIPNDIATVSQLGLAVSFEGTITNTKELETALAVGALALNSAALLAYGFSRWGQDIWQKLEGEWNAIIVASNGPRVIAARSLIGSFPLHYANGTNGRTWLHFDPDWLSAQSGIRDDLDPMRIADFLVDNEDASDGVTMYKAVKRLPPGHSISFGKRQAQLTRFAAWSDYVNLSLQKKSDMQDFTLADLQSAISRKVANDQTSGLLLSGGLDSASIAAALREAQRPSLVFSVVRDANREDEESRLARLCRSHLALPGDFIDIDTAEAKIAISEEFAGFTDPFHCSMLVPALAYRKIAGRGLQVAMDGASADTLFDLGNPILDFIERGHLISAIRRARAEASYWRLEESHELLFAAFRQTCRKIAPIAFSPRVLRDYEHLADLLSAKFFAAYRERREQLADTPFGSGLLPRRLASLRSSQLGAARDRYSLVAARKGIRAIDPFLDLPILQKLLNRHAQTGDLTPKAQLVRAVSSLLPQAIWNAPRRAHLGPEILTRQLRDIDCVPERGMWHQHKSFKSISDVLGISTWSRDGSPSLHLAVLLSWIETQYGKFNRKPSASC